MDMINGCVTVAMTVCVYVCDGPDVCVCVFDGHDEWMCDRGQDCVCVCVCVMDMMNGCVTVAITLCVCVMDMMNGCVAIVCVCVRERERERERKSPGASFTAHLHHLQARPSLPLQQAFHRRPLQHRGSRRPLLPGDPQVCPGAEPHAAGELRVVGVAALAGGREEGKVAGGVAAGARAALLHHRSVAGHRLQQERRQEHPLCQ